SHVRKIKDTMMSGPVRTHEAPSVEGKNDVQVLQANIMENLIVAPLQKCGIDGHHRDESFSRHTGRKCHRVLLCDADVVTPTGNLPRQLVDTGTAAHGCCNPHYLGVFLRQTNQSLSKSIRIGWNRPLLFLGLASKHMKRGNCMIFDRIILCWRITLSLCRQHMHQGWTFNFLDVL